MISAESGVLKSYLAQWDSLKVEKGILYRVWESVDGQTVRDQLVLPRNRVPEVLRSMHDDVSGGHLGINKTLEKIRQRFYWFKCRDDVIPLTSKKHEVSYIPTM